MRTALFRSLKYMRRYAAVAAAAVVAVLLAGAADLAAPQLLRLVIDDGIRRGDMRRILLLCAALLGVSVAGGLATFLQGYWSARASHGSAFEMRDAVFGKLQDLSFSYHDRARTGELITRVTSDVDVVRDFIGGGLVQAVSAMMLLIGAGTLLVWMQWRLALVTFLAIPPTIAVLLLFVRRLGPMFRSFQAKLGALNSVLQENVAGIRVVKAFARESYESERYEAASEALMEQGLEMRTAVANSFPLLSFVSSLGVVAVTWYGAGQVVRAQLTVGELVAFTGYLNLLLQPLFLIGFGAQAIARAGASAQRVFEVLDAPNEVLQSPGASALGRIDGVVRFEAVSFRYPGDTHDSVCDVSFTAGPDEVVALVGPTGAGKSTLVSLIPRFYDVTAGRVTIDGTDVRDVTLDSLRRGIGVVLQDSVLFSGSIADNIAYGRPDARLEDIRAAARTAQADRFIEQLADGYDTRVGERGVRLSGGQRQRVAIARALLIDPRILIMDDSTSSVDTETESALRAALDMAMSGRTTFVIAQRLSTVRRADRILLIDDGRLVARGTHEELLATNALYADIAASQLLPGTAEEPAGETPSDPPDAGGRGAPEGGRSGGER